MRLNKYIDPFMYIVLVVLVVLFVAWLISIIIEIVNLVCEFLRELLDYN